MLATVFTAFLTAQSAAGWHGHGGTKADCCVTCGVETADVAADLCLLQTAPRWLQRERAAHRLRRVEWRCHPDVVGALTFSMLHDCNGEVREEAAESLAKMAPCDPAVHQAFLVSASCDPKLCTRLQARRGLRRLDRRCVGPCGVCAGTVVVPASLVVPIPTLAPVGPPRGGEPLLEPIGPPGTAPPMTPVPGGRPGDPAPPDLPPAALGTSPFGISRRTPAVDSERTADRRGLPLVRRFARGLGPPGRD